MTSTEAAGCGRRAAQAFTAWLELSAAPSKTTAGSIYVRLHAQISYLRVARSADAMTRARPTRTAASCAD